MTDARRHQNAFSILVFSLLMHVVTNALYLRGFCQHRQKNFAAAITDLQEYLKRKPADENAKLDAKYSLALCHAGLKQHNQTIQIANDLLTAKPDYSAADKVR